MKKLLLTATIAGMTTLGISSTANANETIDVESVNKIEMPNAGVKPGSKLYGMDRLMERITIALSMSEESKSEKLMKQAEERLAELNEMDNDQLSELADEVYEDYGFTLDQANEILAKLVSEGNIEKKTLLKLQTKLEKATSMDEEVDAEKLESVSEKVKSRIKEIKSNAYLVALASGMDEEVAKDLKAQGFGYGEIVKLQGLAKLSDQSVEELLALDVYEETETGEIKLDFGKLSSELGFTMKDVLGQFKDVRMKLRENIRESDVNQSSSRIAERNHNSKQKDKK